MRAVLSLAGASRCSRALGPRPMRSRNPQRGASPSDNATACFNGAIASAYLPLRDVQSAQGDNCAKAETAGFEFQSLAALLDFFIARSYLVRAPPRINPSPRFFFVRPVAGNSGIQLPAPASFPRLASSTRSHSH
jgi:hypothetical protein